MRYAHKVAHTFPFKPKGSVSFVTPLWNCLNNNKFWQGHRVRTALNSGALVRSATAALLQKIFRPIVCSLVMTSLSMTEAKLFFVKDSYADRLIIYSLPKDNLNRYVSLTKNCFVISIPHSMYPMVVFIFNTQFWSEHMESWVFLNLMFFS